MITVLVTCDACQESSVVPCGAAVTINDVYARSGMTRTCEPGGAICQVCAKGERPHFEETLSGITPPALEGHD